MVRTKNESEHLHHLNQVLEALEENKLKLN